jgi:hypothetical protein
MEVGFSLDRHSAITVSSYVPRKEIDLTGEELTLDMGFFYRKKLIRPRPASEPLRTRVQYHLFLWLFLRDPSRLDAEILHY